MNKENETMELDDSKLDEVVGGMKVTTAYSDKESVVMSEGAWSAKAEGKLNPKGATGVFAKEADFFSSKPGSMRTGGKPVVKVGGKPVKRGTKFSLFKWFNLFGGDRQ